MPILIICSILTAFFSAFVICLFMAKITSRPAKIQKEGDEPDMAGIKYECVVKDIEVHTKGGNIYQHPTPKFEDYETDSEKARKKLENMIFFDK